MHIYDYSGDDLCATGGKIIGEALMVKGLKGYEHTDATVPITETPIADLKARQIADVWYAKKPECEVRGAQRLESGFPASRGSIALSLSPYAREPAQNMDYMYSSSRFVGTLPRDGGYRLGSG